MEGALPFSDRGLQLVALVTFLLLACAVAFTLAAAYLRAANIRNEKRWIRLEGVWEPMILSVLTGEAAEGELLARVHPRDARRFVEFLLRYARQLKGVERDTVLSLAAPYLERIAGDLRHRRPEIRARTLQTLGELSVAEYSESFLRALEDQSPLVAMTAAQALARHYDPAYAEKLLRVLDRFQHWSIGYLAAMLANMGPESAPVLRAALADPSRPPQIRAVVARTLTSLRDVGSADIASQVLRSKDHIDVVIPVLGLIEKVGGRDQLPVVRRLLRSPDHAVRARAVSTLARIGTPEDGAHIRAALEDESNWVVLHAVRGLKETGETDLLTEVAASESPGAIAAQEMLWSEHA
jgi:HEAT repeat protein